MPEPLWRRSFPIDTDRAASGYPDSVSDTLDEPLLPLPDVEAAHDKDNAADTDTVLKINECVPDDGLQDYHGLQDTCQGICHSTRMPLRLRLTPEAVLRNVAGQSTRALQ